MFIQKFPSASCAPGTVPMQYHSGKQTKACPRGVHAAAGELRNKQHRRVHCTACEQVLTVGKRKSSGAGKGAGPGGKASLGRRGLEREEAPQAAGETLFPGPGCPGGHGPPRPACPRACEPGKRRPPGAPPRAEPGRSACGCAAPGSRPGPGFMARPRVQDQAPSSRPGPGFATKPRVRGQARLRPPSASGLQPAPCPAGEPVTGAARGPALGSPREAAARARPWGRRGDGAPRPSSGPHVHTARGASLSLPLGAAPRENRVHSVSLT